MKIKISDKIYICDTGAIVIFRYRLRLLTSFSEDVKIDFDRAITSLIYISITNENKPDFTDFIELCKKDKKFISKAVNVMEEIFRSDPKAKKNENNEENSFDELDLLALYGESNLPSFLLHEAGILQLSHIINKLYDLKNRKPKPKMATTAEIEAYYGLTPEKKKKIKEYLKNHKGT